MRARLLTAVAGFMAISSQGALGADLPVKAKSVEYVLVCTTYGAGYYYVPGTETCLRLGGYVRFDTYLNAVGTLNPAISSAASTAFKAPGASIGGYPFSTAADPAYLTRARTILDLDARTSTDYGVLRSFLRFGMQWDSQASAGSPAGASAYFERAFIQFAGFTFGYTQSFFDTGIGYMLTTPYAGSNTWTSVIGYTAQFGNGVSATLAVEDAASRTTGLQYGPSTATFASSTTLSSLGGMSYLNAQEGTRVPDFVANLRLDQAWGTAMLSGALHQVAGMTPPAAGAAYLGAAGSDSWGWALGGSLEVKLPMLAAGDSLYLQANYASGALNYLGLSGNYQARASGLGALDLNSGLSTVTGGYYPIADAIWNGSDYAQEKGFALQAQFRHFWQPALRSALYGGYVRLDVPQNAAFSAATVARSASAGQFNAGFDVEMWQAGLNTIWSPVRNLDLGVEVLYSRVSGSLPLSSVSVTGTPAAGTVAMFGGSTDVWSGGIRAQRNF